MNLIKVTVINQFVHQLILFQPSEARYNGRWQTVMRTAVIDVRLTEARFSQGFYVVAMIDNSCGGKKEGGGESLDPESKSSSKQMRIMVKASEDDIGKWILCVVMQTVIFKLSQLSKLLSESLP